MADILMIAITVIFFIGSISYTKACAQLGTGFAEKPSAEKN